jgi:S1-C subfamily serine protease
MTRVIRRATTVALRGIVLLAALVAIWSAGLVSAWAQSPASPPAQAPCQEPLPDLYARVSSAVVSITAMSINPYAVENNVERISGSGVIIDGTGLILTNSHVVFGRQVMLVTLDDGTTLQAKPVGADPLFDIALIKIPPPTKGTLPTAALGDSQKLQVGEEVYAIGNPFGLDQTLTRGIVSAVNRLLPGMTLSLSEPLIQTDAALNPGSSGGPLVNRCGVVVGITTALLPQAQSIGFAIPSSLIRTVIPALVAKGRVLRPWFGVQGQFVVPMLKELLRVPLVDGFLVEVVEPDSPAARAGLAGGDLDVTISGEGILLGGDIITSVNGQALDDPERLGRILANAKIGDTIRVTIVREKEKKDIEVVLVERPLLPGDIPARRSADSGAQPVRRPGSGLFHSVRAAFAP